MKKMLLFGIFIGLYACDDGNLQIEEVDFDEVNIASCPGLDDLTKTTFFYKIDGDEALLLTLAAGLLKNETSKPGTLASTLPEASKLTYRFFSDNVSAAYFCDAVPPLEPTVLKENNATAGKISVDTKVDTLTADTKNYDHEISITDLSLANDQGESLTDTSTLTYGNFITKPVNSAKLDVPFSNYSNIVPAACTTSPIVGGLRLYKGINDEFIFLDVPDPDAIFKNMATPESEPLELDLKDTDIFKYVVLDTLASEELACAVSFGNVIKSWRFVSTAGTLKVETTASAPDADGSITYTHNITLEEMVLTRKGDGADIKKVDLTAIPSVIFGAYTTSSVQ